MGDIENQSILDKRPTIKINHEKDDSLDAEISLLESTLTELKEDEHQCEGHKKLTKKSENMSEVADAIQTNILTGTSSNNTLDKSLLANNNKTNSFAMTNFSGDDININISSTTQHFKSTDTFSLMNNAINVEYFDQQVDNMSSSPSCESVNFQEKTSEEKIAIAMHEQGINNDNGEIIVSQCDSSFEHCKEIKNTTFKNNSTETMEIAVSDLSGDKKDNDYFVSSNSTNLDGTDILNIECSPVHTPKSLNTELECEQVKDTFIGSDINSDVCPTSEHQPDLHKERKYINQSCLSESEAINYFGTSPNQSKENINFWQGSACKSPVLSEDCVAPSGGCKMITGNEYDMISTSQTNSHSKTVVLPLHSITDEKDIMECKDHADIDISEAKSSNEHPPNIYCSTPVASKSGNDIDQISLLNVSSITSQTNRKRKKLALECIEEVDEDDSEIIEEKKLKLTNVSKPFLEYQIADDQNISSSMPCFEAPAKSILKKWQPSFLTRNSGSASFLVLDECAGTDTEESTKPSQDVEPAGTDDFEVAYKSLIEELMRSSSNIETLEKYHSQVQLENQMDDEKFDEVLQELTLTYELDDKTDLPLKIKDNIVLTESNNKIPAKLTENSITATTVKEGEESLQNTSTEVNTTVIDIGCEISNNTTKGKDSNKNIMLQDSNTNSGTALENVTIETMPEKLNEEPQTETTIKEDSPDSGSLKNVAKQEPNNEHTIIYADKDMTVDEEDVLLEEDISARKKPYVFFEFVSSDPKENEDNYNPEWQKLRQLTSDEERYKAVRDRWRSLVPPDPNRDLTCRQWRKRNHQPPLNYRSLNNNHHMNVDAEKSQLCTAVFEMKIKKMVQEFEDSRFKILKARNYDFQQLAITQDKEQMRLNSRGGTELDFAILQKIHIEQCRKLKDRHDLELKRVANITEEKIDILKEASNEVMLFQKFYKGVGSIDDEVCMYMSDNQIQELMETEEMLEEYTKFYK